MSCDIQKWRACAQRIPDRVIRQDALHVLNHKRTHAHGAALFWTLPRKRNRDLLRLLVAYELIWDLLDNLSESAAAQGQTDGRRLHLAIADALDPSAPVSDYYHQHPWRNDGGYLRSLVETCQHSCLNLPSYRYVRDTVLREARRAQVLALNHNPDPARRDAALKQWVAHEYPREHDVNWWEISGAASAPLTIHALLALAAEPACSPSEIAGIYSAYFPWLSSTTTMLDSYVDQIEDAENADHSYVAHYPSAEVAVLSIKGLVTRSISEASNLRNGDKHAVIAAAMIAMYLSKDAARTPQLRAGASTFIDAGGSLTRLLLPILRVWRIANTQRSA